MMLSPMALPYIIVVFGVLLLVLLIWIALLHKKIHGFIRGKNGASLESLLKEIMQTSEKITADYQHIKQEHIVLRKHAQEAVTGLGLVRFNAFKDSGGSQSFAIALLDRNGDGALISTLFARERTSIFAKPIEHGKSTFELTQEESQALTSALSKIQ